MPTVDLTRRSALLAFALLLSGVHGARPRRSIGDGAEVEAFLEAVRRGDLEGVRGWLARDPTLARAVDARGLSAFLHAHLADRPEVARLLLEHGVEPDVVECVFAGDWKRFEALVKADPGLCRALHPIGGTPLYGAVLSDTLDFYRLRSAGCLPDEAPAGGTGFTPARGAMEHRTVSGAWIAATDLLGNGGDVNAPQRGGDSVLHGAVRRRSEALVRLAIRKGADVAARDEQGRTALALATELGWKAGAECLAAQAGLPRDWRRSRFAFDAGGTPVERPDLSDVPREVQSRVTGDSHGRVDSVRSRVDADPRLTFSISSDDELAIEASAHVGHHELMRYHLDQGAPLSLPTAVSLREMEAIERLLDWDPRLVHERGAHDFPLMHFVALGGGGPAVAERLVERGAALDQESMGVTVLHLCARKDDPELARWLIERGCALDPVGHKWNRAGETPLALARREGCARMVSLLREAGASESGRTVDMR